MINQGAEPPSPGAGRYAPSPSGDLHLGNLRTALLAWLFARSTGRAFLLRVEDLDLDRVRSGAEQRQLADLAAIGLGWDGPIVRQSQRLDGYQRAIQQLTDLGRTFECFCSRREIQQAVSAPHAPPGAYPGTCRQLTDVERTARRRVRPPALRLRSDAQKFTISDVLAGQYTGLVDDFVLRRGDGVPAYNLAVVVDDAAQQVDQVVRGDDLLASTPRQAYLATMLGLPVPHYAHVPLVVNQNGDRLAKRDGAVTLADLMPLGWTPAAVRSLLAASLGLAERAESVSTDDLLARFDATTLPRAPWAPAATDSDHPAR